MPDGIWRSLRLGERKCEPPRRSDPQIPSGIPGYTGAAATHETNPAPRPRIDIPLTDRPGGGREQPATCGSALEPGGEHLVRRRAEAPDHPHDARARRAQSERFRCLEPLRLAGIAALEWANRPPGTRVKLEIASHDLLRTLVERTRSDRKSTRLNSSH